MSTPLSTPGLAMPDLATPDLSTLGAGFGDLARGSQAVFRAALSALSHPGRPVAVVHDAEPPAGVHPAAAALLLALLDADTRVWLAPARAAGGAAGWLRFHTGCTVVAEPAGADFIWAGHDELPPLATLPRGTDAYPETSATCVIEVPAFAAAGGPWTLRGPGIDGATRLDLPGTRAGFMRDFATAWTRNHAAFPCGVDAFFATPAQVLGLPRTTQLLQEP